jgi:hypothetical protein
MCVTLPVGSQRSIRSGTGARSLRPAAQVSIMVRTAGEPIASMIAAAILAVSVVSSATPSVAVRPGSAPTTMPSKIAQAMLNSAQSS